MLKFYSLKVGLETPQAELMDKIRSMGAEVIQVSDGLCVKMESPPADWAKDVKGSVQLVELQSDQVLKDPQSSLDLKKFVGG